MNKKLTRLFLTILLWSNITIVLAQVHSPDLPPPSSNISSDFGPRNINNSFDFHEGIDYNPVPGDGDLGYPIISVEDGSVTEIHVSPPYWIEVTGNDGEWMYMHIFRNNDFKVGNWELRVNADLEDPNTHTITQANIIILWSGQVATKVLSNIADRWVKNPDGSYIKDSSDDNIKTKKTVTQNEEIAPMGDSGTTNVHLHFGLNYPNDNPLYHVLHSPDTLPTATIESPSDNYVFTPQELNRDYPIKVLTNSTGGLDLDKVDLWIYKNKDPNQKIPLGSQPTFGYGGQPNEDKTSTIVSSDGSTTGVQPVNNGQDRFIFLQNFGSLNLPEGEHSLVVKTKDVNGNDSTDIVHNFFIQYPYPFVTEATGTTYAGVGCWAHVSHDTTSVTYPLDGYARTYAWSGYNNPREEYGQLDPHTMYSIGYTLDYHQNYGFPIITPIVGNRTWLSFNPETGNASCYLEGWDYNGEFKLEIDSNTVSMYNKAEFEFLCYSLGIEERLPFGLYIDNKIVGQSIVQSPPLINGNNPTFYFNVPMPIEEVIALCASTNKMHTIKLAVSDYHTFNPLSKVSLPSVDAYGHGIYIVLKGWPPNAKLKLTYEPNYQYSSPIISNIATAITGMAGNYLVAVNCSTNVPAYSQVEYGLDTNYGFCTSPSADLSTAHSIDVSGLSPGTYHFRIRAVTVDNFLGYSQDYTFTIPEGPLDTQPPITEIQISEPRYQIADKTYISKTSKISLTATDEGSGVKEIHYQIDDGEWNISVSTYQPINVLTLSEGQHTINYYAIDNAGNTEITKSITIYIDNTSPQSQLSIDGYSIVIDSQTYVNSHSTFTLTAYDPIVNEVASGIKQMQYKIDSGDFIYIPSTFTALQLYSSTPDGLHTITYYATDNVSNTESPKTYPAIFDGTKPQVIETYPANNSYVKHNEVEAIKIKFSEKVTSPNGWVNDISIEEEKGRKIKDLTYNYDEASNTLIITCKLKHHTQYIVKLSTAIVDKVQNHLAEYSFQFSTVVKAKEGGIIKDEETGLTLIIPPNSLPSDGYFEIKLIEIKDLPKLPKPWRWLFGGRKAYQIIFRDIDGNIVREEVKQAFKLVIILKNNWIALALQNSQLAQKDLKLYQTGAIADIVAIALPEEGTKTSSETKANRLLTPQLIKDQSYDSIEENITAELDNFGLFALAGYRAPEKSLDDLSCYPNPFNPTKQNITIQYYLKNDNPVEIAIYDLLGNLVKTWEILSGDQNARAGLNQLKWDGRNGIGDIVAKGGYIVFMHSSNGEKRKFKVLVVK